MTECVNVEQTLEHVIFECPRYEEIRDSLQAVTADLQRRHVECCGMRGSAIGVVLIHRPGHGQRVRNVALVLYHSGAGELELYHQPVSPG